MAVMAKDSHASSRTGINFNVWLDEPDLIAAYEEYLSRQEIPPGKTDVVRLALTEFLTKRGHWPPKKNGGHK